MADDPNDPDWHKTPAAKEKRRALREKVNSFRITICIVPPKRIYFLGAIEFKYGNNARQCVQSPIARFNGTPLL